MNPCPRCAAKPPADARFCPRCGASLGEGCDACPAGAAAGHRFCRRCGRALADPAVLAASLPGPGPLLEGERKQVTVLFADLKGSMELLADRDPEEAHRILEPVLELMTEAVHRYEGTVNQTLGDGIMALFGAPRAQEDHAVRACYAALRMQERVGRYGDNTQRRHGVPLQIRVGINSGEVVVGAVGRERHATYTAVGQTVHLAARMEQMAKPASTLITAHTEPLARSAITTRPLGPVTVKGLDDPLAVFELLGATDVRSRQAASERPLAPFVGRDAELARLHTVADAARAGRGQTIAVVGEAGVGKSRLVRTFVTACRAQGWLVVEGASLSYGKAVAHRPGIELLRRYFDVAATEDARAVRDKVTERLLALDRSLEEDLTPLLAALGALREGSPFLALEPAERRRRMFEAIARVIAHASRTQPLLLVVEDLQWADSETRTALDALVDRLPPRTTLLVNYRPDADDGWTGKAAYTRIALAPLLVAEATSLLDALLGPHPSLTVLKRTLVERTAGNPLFLEESVRALVDDGALAGERGAYRLTSSPAGVHVPPTVQAVLAARIDRLAPDHKHLLQCAAVVGEEVPVSLLEAIADVPGATVRTGLEALRSAGLLDRTALFPDLQYTFAHSLTHDVTYASLLHERRRRLHVRILDAMERLHADALDERVEQLAHHAFHGEAWDRASDYLRRAGAAAMARLASPEAARFFEQAIEVGARLPATEHTRAREVDLRCDVHNALAPVGEHPRALAHLRAALAVAEVLGDEPRMARVLWFRSNVLWNTGDVDAALDAGRQALALAERAGNVDLQVIGNFSMGGAYRALGDYPRAVALLSRNVQRLQGPLRFETYGLPGLAAVLSRSHLAWSLAELGELRQAVAHAEEGLAIAREAGHRYSLAHASLGLGGTLLRQRKLDEAIAVLEPGLATCEHVPALFPPIAADLGLALAWAGRAGEGVALLIQAVERLERLGRLGRLSLIVAHLGEGYLAAGRVEPARAAATRALDLARAHQERGNEAYALLLSAAVAAAPPRPCVAEAATWYRSALELAEALGMRPLVARCRLGLGTLAFDQMHAREEVVAAAARFREMQMVGWAREAEVRLGQPPLT